MEKIFKSEAKSQINNDSDYLTIACGHYKQLNDYRRDDNLAISQQYTIVKSNDKLKL